MATFNDLYDAVSDILSSSVAVPSLQLNSATRERAFEVYVFCLIIKAVKQASGIVKIMGIKTGQNPNPIIFRGSPGHMSSQAQDFAYAECTLNNKEFEIHLGVQYVGTSTALHEVDVSLFDHDRADQIRLEGILPSTRNLRAAIECKFYDSNLGVTLGRTFVGLVSDLGGLKIKIFASNGRSSGLADYFSKSDRPNPFFALTPLRPDIEDRFVRSVEQDLRKWCSVY
ncbi:MAG: hypothetical protein GYB33_08660 [Gammaproteobacteria bacterium]|nr:hypothetical protein [Gammaproteobacteria bacterium]